MACQLKKQLAQAARTPIVKPPPKEGEPYGPPAEGLICWWCVHPLPQRPCIHLPIKYDDRLDRFMTIGNFCSWACAKAYAVDMKTSRSGEIQSILAMMRRRAYGKFVPLWHAPRREALACFGGTMTIEEFRTYGGDVEPPMVHFPFEKRYEVSIGASTCVPTATDVTRSSTGGARRLAAIESATAETDTLKLKRSKPLPRAESKLENMLGIKRSGKV